MVSTITGKVGVLSYWRIMSVKRPIQFASLYCLALHELRLIHWPCLAQPDCDMEEVSVRSARPRQHPVLSLNTDCREAAIQGKMCILNLNLKHPLAPLAAQSALKVLVALKACTDKPRQLCTGSCRGQDVHPELGCEAQHEPGYAQCPKGPNCSQSMH